MREEQKAATWGMRKGCVKNRALPPGGCGKEMCVKSEFLPPSLEKSFVGRPPHLHLQEVPVFLTMNLWPALTYK